MKTTTDDDADLIGANVRKSREAMGWSQQRLADALALDHAQIISNIEKGQRELKAWELFRISRVLHVPVEALLGSMDRDVPAVKWRARIAEHTSDSETLFIRRCERYALLERWCEVPPFQDLKPLTLSSAKPGFGKVGREAETVREAMRLGGRPSCTLEKTLEEDYGVKIFYSDMGEDGAGLSATGAAFGHAIMLNSRNKPWRRNYSLAHELFHLLTPPEWQSDECERLADVFASVLLLPAEPLMSAVSARLEAGKISHDNLVEIACEFDVSIEALMWRLVNLGRLDKQTVEAALIPISPLRALDRMIRADRSYRIPSELPERYVRLCHLAYRRGKIGRAKLAEFLEVSLVDLSDQLDAEDAEGLNGAEAELAVAGC